MGRQREASRSTSGFLQGPPLPLTPANRSVACGLPLLHPPPIRSGNELGVSTSIIVKLRFQRGERRERREGGEPHDASFSSREGERREGEGGHDFSPPSPPPPFCAPLALLLSFFSSLSSPFIPGRMGVRTVSLLECQNAVTSMLQYLF